MNDAIETTAISDEYAVNRMFELVTEGRTASEEYARLDQVIRSRLLAAYDDGTLEDANQAHAVAS